MKPFVRHIALPAIAPAAVVALYLTPVQVFGCSNRGRMALAVVLVSTAAAFTTIALCFLAKKRDRKESNRWLASTIVLALPILMVAGPLG
jgi:hypothetical protein